jgi:hypothetical protein
MGVPIDGQQCEQQQAPHMLRYDGKSCCLHPTHACLLQMPATTALLTQRFAGICF